MYVAQRDAVSGDRVKSFGQEVWLKLILQTQHYMQIVFSFTPRPLYRQGKSPVTH